MSGVIVGILIFMVGTLFVGFIQDEVYRAQGVLSGDTTSPNLNCGTANNPNQSISDGTKLACLTTEIINPYFIILIISIAGGAIFSRLSFGGRG